MSEGSEELVRQVVDAANRQDADAFVATVSPGVEWEDALVWTEGARAYRGRAEVRDWLEHVLEPWEDLQMEAEEITDASDGRLLVGFRYRRARQGKRRGNTASLLDGLVDR